MERSWFFDLWQEMAALGVFSVAISLGLALQDAKRPRRVEPSKWEHGETVKQWMQGESLAVEAIFVSFFAVAVGVGVNVGTEWVAGKDGHDPFNGVIILLMTASLAALVGLSAIQWSLRDPWQEINIASLLTQLQTYREGTQSLVLQDLRYAKSALARIETQSNRVRKRWPRRYVPEYVSPENRNDMPKVHLRHTLLWSFGGATRTPMYGLVILSNTVCTVYCLGLLAIIFQAHQTSNYSAHMFMVLVAVAVLVSSIIAVFWVARRDLKYRIGVEVENRIRIRQCKSIINELAVPSAVIKQGPVSDVGSSMRRRQLSVARVVVPEYVIAAGISAGVAAAAVAALARSRRR